MGRERKKKKKKTKFWIPSPHPSIPFIPRLRLTPLYPTHLPVLWEWRFMISKTFSLAVLSPFSLFHCRSSPKPVDFHHMDVPWYHLPQFLFLSWPTRSFVLFSPFLVEQWDWENCQPVKVNLLLKTVFFTLLC